MIEEVAPAKINLFLHVGPRRADGLHDLASLFVFSEEGDAVSAAPAEKLSLEIKGPFAPALAAFALETNLVWRAAEALKAAATIETGAALVLDKRLPVAAGIGGGSADAAAALRALIRLWDVEISDEALADIAFGLGADVPACLAQSPVYVRGAGEIVEQGPALPPLWITLVNPGVETPTGPIFRDFDSANPSPSAPALERESAFRDGAALAAYLARTRNDLEPFAMLREHLIVASRDYLAECDGCLITRMSGSGATVFALFDAKEAAEHAARGAEARGWWAMATRLASHG